MKNLIILIFLCPIFTFGQQKSATTTQGFGLHCGVGSGRCIEMQEKNSENLIFNVSVQNETTLMLSAPIELITEDLQNAILGKLFIQYAENEQMQINQLEDYPFSAMECRNLGLNFAENYAVAQGLHNTFIHDETFFIVLTIKKL